MEEILKAMVQFKDELNWTLQNCSSFKQNLENYFEEVYNEDVEVLSQGERIEQIKQEV